MCSGDSTYWRSSPRACLSLARSTIQRLLRETVEQDTDTVTEHRAYLCELTQKSVAIEAYRSFEAWRGRGSLAGIRWTSQRRPCLGPVLFSCTTKTNLQKCPRPSQLHHEGVIESASGAWHRPRHHPQILQILRRTKRRKSLLFIRRL
jgi:hypothetical protein